MKKITSADNIAAIVLSGILLTGCTGQAETQENEASEPVPVTSASLEETVSSVTAEPEETEETETVTEAETVAETEPVSENEVKKQYFSGIYGVFKYKGENISSVGLFTSDDKQIYYADYSYPDSGARAYSITPDGQRKWVSSDIQVPILEMGVFQTFGLSDLPEDDEYYYYKVEKSDDGSVTEIFEYSAVANDYVEKDELISYKRYENGFCVMDIMPTMDAKIVTEEEKEAAKEDYIGIVYVVDDQGNILEEQYYGYSFVNNELIKNEKCISEMNNNIEFNENGLVTKNIRTYFSVVDDYNSVDIYECAYDQNGFPECYVEYEPAEDGETIVTINTLLLYVPSLDGSEKVDKIRIENITV